MDKKTITWNFSRHAHVYDQYADVQRKAGFELLSRIKKGYFNRILEAGCGTGNYTLLLKNKFKDARIKAVDISGKMIEVAGDKLRDRDIELMVLDAETMDLDEEFDLITSNACFQWFEDLEKALLRYKNLLKEDGVILFSVFGPLTFQELDFSLRRVLRHSSIAAAGFISQEKLENILYDNFKDVMIEEIKYEESFPSLMDLLNKIKYTGIRGCGLGNKSFNRRTLKEIEQVYLNKFHKIKATYQVFFCQGRMG